MSKTDHLANAKECIRRGEDYYRKAAEHIVAAKKADLGLTNEAIGAELGHSESWVRKLINGLDNSSAATIDWQSGPKTQGDIVRSAVANRPEVIAEAIASAPQEVQAKIADELVKAPEIEPSLKRVAEGPKAHPRPAKPPWQRLEEATFGLWEVGEDLRDQAPTDEEKVRMLSSAEKAQRLANGIVSLLSTSEFEEEFRNLLEEVGAES